jgi:hypothetical protein
MRSKLFVATPDGRDAAKPRRTSARASELQRANHWSKRGTGPTGARTRPRETGAPTRVFAGFSKGGGSKAWPDLPSAQLHSVS